MVVCWGGCAGSSLRQGPTIAGPSAELGESAEPRAAQQHLFRVGYSGPRGSGSLRLVLRLQSADFFQLATADSLGRPLWTLQLADASTIFLDHREQIYCVSEADIRLGEVTLEMFPLTSVPRLLLGRLPIELGEGTRRGESTEYRDDQDRRWSVRTAADEDEIAAWTLWVADAPTLWWTRQGKGGILSHRDGSQFRWRQVVEEPMESNLSRLTPPESFRQISCHADDLPEFRQDQSSPPGGGASR